MAATTELNTGFKSTPTRRVISKPSQGLIMLIMDSYRTSVAVSAAHAARHAHIPAWTAVRKSGHVIQLDDLVSCWRLGATAGPSPSAHYSVLAETVTGERESHAGHHREMTY